VECDVAVDDAGITVTLAGEIDISAADELRNWLIAASKGHEVLGIDLGNVGFMDSTGLHMLISLKRELEENGQEFHLAALSEPVEELLNVSGLTTFFD
jgi:anti-anti-sigma factor